MSDEEVERLLKEIGERDRLLRDAGIGYTRSPYGYRWRRESDFRDLMLSGDTED